MILNEKFFQKNKKDEKEKVVEQLLVDDGLNRLQEKKHQSIHGMDRLQKSI